MNNIFGNKPVYGDNYFGREPFVKLLVGILLSGNSFLLLGLRRIGKSSTIKQAIHKIKALNPEAEIIDLNCQTYKNIQDFYKHLHLAIPKDWQTQLRKALKESKRIPTKIIDVITDHVEEIDLPYLGSVKLRNDVIQYANPLKEEITAFFQKQDKQIILFIDELPFLFESISKSGNEITGIEIESILSTLRNWRDIGIAQAICGSLNLHQQLDHLGISRKLLGGLNTQRLPVYSREEAFGLLKALAESESFDLRDDQIETMLNAIPDHIPQFLQLYYFIVKTYLDDANSDVRLLYEKHVYPSIVEDFEYQFNERLSLFKGDDLKTAIQLLNKVKEKPGIHESALIQSVKSDDSYALLLQLVDHEFLVYDHEQNYNFSFNIIRNWWIKKNLKG